MSAAPSPIAQGDLSETPFAHVLVQIHQKELSGTLAIWPSEPGAKGQDRVRFVAGWIEAARFVEPTGVLARGMLRFFARTSGPYAFYEADLVGEGGLEERVDPWMVLAASLRGGARDDVVSAILERFDDGSRLRIKPGTDTKRFAPQPKEAAFFELIRAAPATVDELASQCELGEAMGRRLLYLLVVTSALEPAPTTSPRGHRRRLGVDPAARAAPLTGSASASAPDAPADLPLPELPLPPPPSIAPPPRTSMRPSDGAARLSRSIAAPPPPPAGLSDAGLAFWREVEERAAKIDQQNYFDMLDVPRDASTEDVRRAYFALAKRWHPDRITQELLPLRPLVEPIFTIFSTAEQTLSDETKRAAYLRNVQEGGGTPEADRKVEAILWAAKEHQKAEVLLRRRDFEGASAIVKAALEVVPDDPDLLATQAWCLYNLPNSDARLPEMRALVDRAIELEPKHDRAHYHRAMILEREGKDDEALEDFRRALRINPKNADAERAVRIAEMRRAKGGRDGAKAPKGADAAEKKDTGFFSKLFGGKKS